MANLQMKLFGISEARRSSISVPFDLYRKGLLSGDIPSYCQPAPKLKSTPTLKSTPAIVQNGGSVTTGVHGKEQIITIYDLDHMLKNVVEVFVQVIPLQSKTNLYAMPVHTPLALLQEPAFEQSFGQGTAVVKQSSPRNFEVQLHSPFTSIYITNTIVNEKSKNCNESSL
ncbi:hypothetical protein ACTFIR_005592 [Dictyostelium discoideum]